MYTQYDYTNKKAIKTDVAELTALRQNPAKTEQEQRRQNGLETRLSVYQPGGIWDAPTKSCRVYIEGPHAPKPHRFYGQGQTDENGILVKIS